MFRAISLLCSLVACGLLIWVVYRAWLTISLLTTKLKQRRFLQCP